MAQFFSITIILLPELARGETNRLGIAHAYALSQPKRISQSWRYVMLMS